MVADERVDAIFEAADKLRDELETAIQNNDAAAQQLIMIKFSRIATALERVKVGHHVTFFGIMTAVERASDPQERRKALLNAFEYAAGYRATAYEDLADDELTAKVEAQLQGIIDELDALPPDGRAALVPFLAGYNMDLRASAAVALYDAMPERVGPILQDLAEKEAGTSAGMLAMAALAAREP